MQSVSSKLLFYLLSCFSIYFCLYNNSVAFLNRLVIPTLLFMFRNSGLKTAGKFLVCEWLLYTVHLNDVGGLFSLGTSHVGILGSFELVRFPREDSCRLFSGGMKDWLLAFWVLKGRWWERVVFDLHSVLLTRCAVFSPVPCLRLCLYPENTLPFVC